jgi:hypothetical protein
MNPMVSTGDPPSSSAPAFPQARVMLLLGLGLTLVLYAVPKLYFLAYPFMMISTVAHEMGHGVTAILVGGSFERVEIWSDGSGVARWRGTDVGRLGYALVAAGGLVGPAIAAAIAFLAGRTARGARRCLITTTVLLFLAEILVVRGFFGFLFVGFLALVCALIDWKGSEEIIQIWVVFLELKLALSVYSRGDYLFTAVAKTGSGIMPSDAGVIAAALFLPYWFWGGLCGAFSVLVLGFAVKAYWR